MNATKSYLMGRRYVQGQRSEFHLQQRDIGDPTKIRISHGVFEQTGSWFVDKIIVTHLTTGTASIFKVDRWLDVRGGTMSFCSPHSRL